jgi:hypothetical protein
MARVRVFTVAVKVPDRAKFYSPREVLDYFRASGFPLPSPGRFPISRVPLHAALFTNEDPEGFHAANLQNRPS